MTTLEKIIFFGALLLGSLFGYRFGKYNADHWYAKQLSQLPRRFRPDSSITYQRQLFGMDESPDVTLIGHHITVVNGSHVIVIQCSDETVGSAVALNTGTTLICSDIGEFSWEHPVSGGAK